VINAFVESSIRTATRPTWAEISLAALRQNYCALKQHLGVQINICAVIKADAYGHGATPCALALQEEGSDWFGVTSLDEAIPLRDFGIRARILLMTGFWPGEQEELIRLDLTPTIWTLDQVSLLEKSSAALGRRAYPVHLKIDTGMGRLGVSLEDLPQLCAVLHTSPHLRLEGVSTHLASSEVLDDPSVDEQLRAFDRARATLRDSGFDPSLIHLANTSAMLSRRQTWHNMVRPGLALYGYQLPVQRNGNQMPGNVLPLQPVLSWKTRILSIRNIPANQAIGYGGTYRTRSSSRIAVLPLGYADGLNRQLSSRGRVIIRGNYAPIVGRISMDLTLVDVTAIPGASEGDEAILIGASGGIEVSAHEHAELCGTIPYEILCAISKRVPRRYIP
jgi:alanine racemase